MMSIPYEDILVLFRLKKDEDTKKGIKQYLAKRKREKEVKKIIRILEDTYSERNNMYKKDIYKFCLFLEALEIILDKKLDEFNSSNSVYIKKVDNINYQVSYKFNYQDTFMRNKDVKVTLTTVDTVSNTYNYFIYTKETSINGEVPRIKQRSVFDIDTFDYYVYNDTTMVYRSTIEIIIKYLKLLLE